MRTAITILFSVVLCGTATPDVYAQDRSNMVQMPHGELQIEIQSPSADFTAVEGETTIDVEGIASAIGGVQYLDMIFVMDTSASLRKTDPKGYRSLGAIGLVRNLSPRSNIHIGVVSFDKKGQLAQPMTADREQVIHFWPPGYCVLEMSIRPAGVEDPEEERRMVVLSPITPETEKSHHQFLCFYRNFDLDNAKLTEIMMDEVYRTALEDTEMLEAQQRNMDADPPDHRPVNLRVDQGPIAARRMIQRLLAEQ